MIGGLLDHYSSEMRNRQMDSLIDAQALLLANKGLGNLYTEAGKVELNRGGTKAIEHFQKALKINPNDKEALASLSAILALELSNQNWLSRSKGKKYQEMLSIAKVYATKGKQIAQHDPVFYDILGIIYDVEGKHDQARSEFRKSGALRTDPYWHLLMATSWGMSKQNGNELAEVREAIKKGAKYWLVDFCYGRALNSTGDYEQAVVELKKALQSRKWHPQVLRQLADAYYFQGRFGEAAKYAALCGLALVRWFPASSFRHFGLCLHHFGLHLVTRFSKRVWPISRHVPIINRLHMRFCNPAQPEETLGFMLIRQGHYKFAEKHLRKACETLPVSPYLLANLCGCLALQGKRKEAIEKCEMAIQCANNESMLAQLRQQKKDLESDAYEGPKRIVEIDAKTGQMVK
jgi:Flp pilus assembly protein TadD